MGRRSLVRRLNLKAPLLFFILLLFMVIGSSTAFAVADRHIYDEGNLLSESEINELEAVAAEHSRKHGVDFLLYTSTSTEVYYIFDYMGDFFDNWAEENNQENAVLLTINSETREVYLAGFGTAETSLNNERVEMVLDRIMDEMRADDFGGAFQTTVTTASRYMEFRPGVNPENIFFKNWFQIAIALLLAGLVVGYMIYNSGGKVTTTDRTYFDNKNSKVTIKKDVFRNKTVTRRKVQKESSGGGGGGYKGGGRTSGGRSYSGGGRKF